MKIIKGLFILSILVSISFLNISYAGTYYVSSTGSAPWSQCTNITIPCSASSAMANAVAGDIVYFRGGTYDVGVLGANWDYPNMNPSNSGTSGSPITFVAYPGETPIITGSVDSNSRAAMFGCGHRNYIVWDGFFATMVAFITGEGQTFGLWYSDHCTIKNCSLTGINHSGSTTNYSLVRIQESSNSTIENNLFQNLGGDATSVNTTAIWMFVSSNITIKNNNFIGTRGAIYSKNGPNVATISHNFIRGLSGIYACSRGIRPASQTPIVNSDVSIFQNIVVDCASAIGLLGGEGNFTVINPKIYNNTVYGGGSTAGLESDDMSRNAEIYNNILMNVSGNQLRYYTGLSSPTVSDYNDFYRASGSLTWNLNYATDYSTIEAWRTATSFDTHSITSNPLFVNAGGTSPDDYRLTTGSPAKGVGRYGGDLGAFVKEYGTRIGYQSPQRPTPPTVNP